MASLGSKVIHGLFRVGEVVSPRLSGVAAFELFCRTPGATPRTDAERRALDRASGVMASARHHPLSCGTQRVVVHEFRPEPGHVETGRALVVHGWYSRTDYMTAIVDGLRSAGKRVYAIDLPGHGASGGRRLTLIDAVAAVSQAGAWFGPFDVVVGHSFGGAVAVNAVAGSVQGVAPLAAERLVLIAAPESTGRVLDGFGAMIGLGRRSKAAMVTRIERVAARPLSAFDGAALLSGLAVPTLVMHAPDDREVAAAEAERYATAGPHVTVNWVPGAGHRRILSDRDAVKAIVAFASFGQAMRRAG